jgi:radical SAM protein with 4Fe4S-binding SPASM domain
MSGGAGFPPPARALWEITARCDLRCDHCLIDGGPAQADELSTDEALGLVDQLAQLGVGAVSLTGGEPLLRPDWEPIARRIRERGMILRLSSNGHLLADRTLASLVGLGCELYTLSLDGLEATHDRVRHGPRGEGGRSSFRRVVAALERLRGTPIRTEAITSVGRHNLRELSAIHDLLKRLGVSMWMLQLAHRTGRMAQPGPAQDAVGPLTEDELLEVEAFIVAVSADPALQPIAHNSVGYMSRAEPVLRSSGRKGPARFWTGCACGKASVGIAPDGGVKGCANQIGAPFVVGNVREEPLRAIWEDRARWHWLDPPPERMTGACAGCALAAICQAGCTALAHSATGGLYENAYCLRRAGRARGEGEA